MAWPKLADFPLAARVAVTAYLVTTGFGYNYAIANVVMKVGATPGAVAAHYGGGKVPNPEAKKALEAPKSGPPKAAEGEEAFDLDKDEAEPPPPPPPFIDLPAPSLGALVQEGHTHIFGMGSLFFGVVLCALFLSLAEPLKAVLAATPFFAIVLDHLGFLATRFWGPKYAFLVMVAGSLMAFSHLAITTLALFQMWIRKPNPKPAGDA